MQPQGINRCVQAIMAAALVITGIPLLLPLLPSGAPAARTPAADEVGPSTTRIEVELRQHLSPEELAALDARDSVSLRENSAAEADERVLVGDVTAEQEAAALDRLRHDPLVQAAEPMHFYHEYMVPNDTRYPEQWNLKMIGMEKAWDSATGKGVTVAVIDTGVASELDEKCYQAKDFSQTRFAQGYDFVNHDEHAFDDNGHGTHVAGTIAESTNNGEGAAGIAYEATIMPLKVLSAFGSGTSADIADAIRFAADHGANIINMSLGGPYPDRLMGNACAYAAKKGVLIVCAAGNSGGGPVGYPAAFKECLAVSAVGPSGELAPYSSIGKEVGIAAPGGDTSAGPQGGILQNTLLDGDRSTDGYYAFQGTSMASPHVAAVAALVMSRGVKDPAEVRQILERSAVAKKPSPQYGAGVLSAAKAVELAGTTERDSLLKLLFTMAAAIGALGLGSVRKGVGKLTRFPFAPLGFVLGMLGPDFVFGWLGWGTSWSIAFHSALIPLYLLWEAESPAANRFVGAMALGVACHLGWDALRGDTPFGGILPIHAIPWMWVNVLVGAGVALVAWRRSVARG